MNWDYRKKVNDSLVPVGNTNSIHRKVVFSFDRAVPQIDTETRWVTFLLQWPVIEVIE